MSSSTIHPLPCSSTPKAPSKHQSPKRISSFDVSSHLNSQSPYRNARVSVSLSSWATPCPQAAIRLNDVLKSSNLAERSELLLSNYQEVSLYTDDIPSTLARVASEQEAFLEDKYKYYLKKIKEEHQEYLRSKALFESLSKTVEESPPIQDEIKSIEFIKQVSADTLAKLHETEVRVSQLLEIKTSYSKQASELKRNLMAEKSSMFLMKRDINTLRTKLDEELEKRKVANIKQTMKKVARQSIMDQQDLIRTTLKQYELTHQSENADSQFSANSISKTQQSNSRMSRLLNNFKSQQSEEQLPNPTEPTLEHSKTIQLRTPMLLGQSSQLSIRLERLKETFFRVTHLTQKSIFTQTQTKLKRQMLANRTVTKVIGESKQHFFKKQTANLSQSINGDRNSLGSESVCQGSNMVTSARFLNSSRDNFSALNCTGSLLCKQNSPSLLQRDTFMSIGSLELLYKLKMSCQLEIITKLFDSMILTS